MKNLIVTVNGVAYNVTVEEGTGAPVAKWSKWISTNAAW